MRGLQEKNSVTIMYSQIFTYESVSPSVTALFLASAPFAEQESRDEYLVLLGGSGDATLADVESTSSVEVGTTPPPAEEPTKAPVTEPPTASPSKAPTTTDGDGDGGSDGLSTGAIVGIAVGAGVAVIFCLLVCFFSSGTGDGDYEAGDDEPPHVLKVPVAGDEVSTLAPPTHVHSGATRSNEEMGGYGDQRCVFVLMD
jgi:hypothetical protein